MADVLANQHITGTHKEGWQITLDRLYGSVKNIKRLTKEERNKLAEEITEEEQEILFRKVGLS